MKPVWFAVSEAPHNLFVPCDLKQFHGVALGSVAGHNKITVRKQLSAARVFERCIRKVVVRNAPHFIAFRIHFDHAIAVGEVYKCVAVWNSDRGEWPAVLRQFRRLVLPDNRALRSVFSHHPIEQLRYKVVSIGQAAGHAGLHVMVGELALYRGFDDDFSGPINFKDPRVGSCLRKQDVAVTQQLGSIHLGLRTLVFEENFIFPCDLHHAPAGIVFGFRKRQ